MPRSVTKTIAGWGNFPRASCCLFRPQKRAEVARILTAPTQPTYIARGLGRSYGDAAINHDQGVILQSQLDRLLDFDDATGVLECEGGADLGTIIDALLPRGFFPPVVPGTKFVTIGGAIAADIHGKNHHRDGSLAQWLVDLTLLTPNGELLTCSPQQHTDVFWATIGGMGLTGVILTARLRTQRVESAYIRVSHRQAEHLDQLLDEFDEHDQDHRYSVAWFDCFAREGSLGRGVLMAGDHATKEDLAEAIRLDPLSAPHRRKHTVPCFMPAALLNPLTARAFNALYYRRHPDSTRIVDVDRFFFPLDGVHHWNRIYGKRGFAQYQAVLPGPAETGRRGIKTIIERVAESGQASYLAVLKKLGPSSEGLLSFPLEGYTLTLDFPNKGNSMVRLLQELDRIVLDHGGRVYLAKDACLERATFEAMYPDLDRFRQIKARLDPGSRIASSQARRLGIVEC